MHYEAGYILQLSKLYYPYRRDWLASFSLLLGKLTSLYLKAGRTVADVATYAAVVCAWRLVWVHSLPAECKAGAWQGWGWLDIVLWTMYWVTKVLWQNLVQKYCPKLGYRLASSWRRWRQSPARAPKRYCGLLEPFGEFSSFLRTRSIFDDNQLVKHSSYMGKIEFECWRSAGMAFKSFLWHETRLSLYGVMYLSNNR